jgi:hypothetical protein
VVCHRNVGRVQLPGLFSRSLIRTKQDKIHAARMRLGQSQGMSECNREE